MLYTLYQILKSIILAIILLTLTFVLFGTPHIEIGSRFYIISVFLTFFTLLIYCFIYKLLFPKLFNKFLFWLKKTNVYGFGLTIIPIGISLLFFSEGLSYFNQQKPTSPIETIPTTVVNKYFKRDRYTDASYVEIQTPWGILKINDLNIYNTLNIDDDVALTIQKGRLGSYFALKIQSKKNNFTAPL